MHYWGDEWFQKYGSSFYKAIGKLESRMRSWARVGVCGKEKWGMYRSDFLTFWDGGLTQIFFGYRARYRGFAHLLYNFDHYLIPIKKTKYGWLRVGFADLIRVIGLQKLVQKWQTEQVNKAFQVTCKEYPQFIDELVADVDCYEIIKPGKWGDVDGEKIHWKHWKKIEIPQN